MPLKRVLLRPQNWSRLQTLLLKLGCRKWGFKRWGFKEIRGYLRKKAFFLRFLDFPGALQEKGEKGRKRPISADFREGRPDTPLNPHLLHPHLRQPNEALVPPSRSFLSEKVSLEGQELLGGNFGPD